MRYNSRAEVEAAGRAGSQFEVDELGLRARILNRFWLYLDEEDEGFVPHQTTKGEGFWEAWITLWISQNVQPGSVCLDIGANIGYYTMMLADHGCSVIAVEPQPRLASLIEKSAKYNDLDHVVQVDQLAIDESPGIVSLTVPSRHGMNAWITSLGYEEIEGSTRIYVPCHTLDEYTGSYDFVKIDAEGVEERLFRGARKFMERNPDCVYLVEWGAGRLNNAAQACEEIFELMEVAYVGFDGMEVPIRTATELFLLSSGDWLMLVLRSRK